jgi:hypothetical protein
MEDSVLHTDERPPAVLQGGDDRFLTDAELKRLEESEDGSIGLLSVRQDLEHYAPRTLFEMRQRNAEIAALKKQAKLLGELDGFVSAHRDHAEEIYSAKLAIISSLLEEMTVTFTNGKKKIDTKRMNHKRLKVLFGFLEQFEKRAYGAATQTVNHEGSVDVRHVVAQVKQGLIDAGD